MAKVLPTGERCSDCGLDFVNEEGHCEGCNECVNMCYGDCAWQEQHVCHCNMTEEDVKEAHYPFPNAEDCENNTHFQEAQSLDGYDYSAFQLGGGFWHSETEFRSSFKNYIFNEFYPLAWRFSLGPEDCEEFEEWWENVASAFCEARNC